MAVSIDVEEELEGDIDFQLLEAMKAFGREYIRKNLSHFTPNDEQRMAVVLNPKMKQLRRMSPFDREHTYELIDCFVRTQNTGQTNTDTDTKGVNETSKRNDALVSLAGFEDIDEMKGDSIYSDEFAKYLIEKVQIMKSSLDLRCWWYENRDRFPSLFKLFMKISTIPASSAPSERTFSTAGQIITDRRSALLPNSVSNIMICRNIYRS